MSAVNQDLHFKGPITVKMNGLSTEEDSGSQHDQVCCLVDAGERCTQSAGNAAYNKRIQKTVAQRKLRLHMDSTSSHNYICEHHKSVIQSVRVKRKRRESEEDSGEFDGDHPEVELYNLQILMKHFKTVPVAEKECLTYFIYMIKANRSKFDQRNGSSIDM
ncbi:histone deacetylase complex subunit SAP30-like [Homarus americanus]|uniref:Histone deacetylase complex subunit SAP30-like n=1 Tax=Homarus americanus TaxID=6706 RepID=A0A8J5N824_HOMAM|nr:histone deacetylase complex subunit SAP30-like [Homarus americanus]